jgi:hypothetical protein
MVVSTRPPSMWTPPYQATTAALLVVAVTLGGVPVSGACGEGETWNGHCTLIGDSWSLEITVQETRPAGCYAGDYATSTAAPPTQLRQVGGARLAGPTAPGECMRLCLATDPAGGPRSRWVGIATEDQGCICSHADPRRTLAPAPTGSCPPIPGQMPPHAAASQQCQAPVADRLGECAALLQSGLFHCGRDFCSDPGRCPRAGACDSTCSYPACSSVHPVAIQLYEVVGSQDLARALPPGLLGGADAPCARRSRASSSSSSPSSINSSVLCSRVQLHHPAVTAAMACCACGGGIVNAFGVCSDSPPGWRSPHGDCADYAARRYCSTAARPGAGWQPEWGPLDQASGVDVGVVVASVDIGDGRQVALWRARSDSVPLNSLAQVRVLRPFLSFPEWRWAWRD